MTDRLMTGAEVAQLFRVSPRTVARWARQGLLSSVLVPGGRLRRYPEGEVRRLAATRGGNSS